MGKNTLSKEVLSSIVMHYGLATGTKIKNLQQLEEKIWKFATEDESCPEYVGKILLEYLGYDKNGT